LCEFRGTGLHPRHIYGDGSNILNEAYVVPEDRHESKSKLKDMAQRVREHSAPTRTIVRESDPPTAHLAAERIQPKRGTRKALVLACLTGAGGDWVDGVIIATPEIGGSEGIRRLRELRDDGWNIETRPHPQSETAWQYRLVQAQSALRNLD
jgi:hypothetical protein